MDSQRQIPILSSVEPNGMVENSLVVLCQDYLDALKLCIQLSRIKRTQNELAFLIGINPTQLSKILHGKDAKGKKWHLDPDLISRIQDACGNKAIIQYLVKKDGCLIQCETDKQKIARLEEELRKAKDRRKETRRAA